MLKKHFFITPDSSTKFFIFIIILMLFAFKLFLFLAAIYIVLLMLFRKKAINPSTVRTIDPTIAIMPCDGTLAHIESSDGGARKLVLKVGIFDHYGIRMPFSGSVSNFTEAKEKYFTIGKWTIYKYLTTVELKSKELGKLKLHFKSITNLAPTKIWVRSGDKATVGAYLGYLPFGGKVVIELPSELNLLVKENDNLLSAQTLLASKGKENA